MKSSTNHLAPIDAYAESSRYFYSNMIPKMLQQYLKLSKAATVLDCGCGDGNFLRALDQHGFLRNREVYALDLSATRIERVKKLNSLFKTSVDSVETLSTIPDGAIDFLISTQVIEHVDDDKMLGAIARVTKPGSMIYLTTVFKKWYGWYFYRKNGRFVLDPTHIREYREDSELLDKISPALFSVVENIKTQTYYPAADIFLRIFRIKDHNIYQNNWLPAWLEKIKIPIFGYQTWELLLKRL